jgi:hypothetical protein
MVLLEKYKKLFDELLSDPYHASDLHYKELEIMACLVNVILSQPIDYELKELIQYVIHNLGESLHTLTLNSRFLKGC